MTRAGAEGAVVLSALVVGSTWAYRKLIEPASSKPAGRGGAKALAGLESTPAPAGEFGIAFGFIYLTLSVTASFAPELAGSLAVMIAVGDVLANGSAVFVDVGNQVAKGAGGKAAKA